MDEISHELERRLAQEHLPRFRGLLQPGGGIDRVPDDERVPHRCAAGQHLARVHACARLQLHTDVTQVVVQTCERSLHLQRCAHRAQGIILVQARYAEDRHHRIADELLDGAAVTFDRLAHRVVVGGHDVEEHLGIELLSQRRGADHVREDDGYGLAQSLARARSRR